VFGVGLWGGAGENHGLCEVRQLLQTVAYLVDCLEAGFLQVRCVRNGETCSSALELATRDVNFIRFRLGSFEQGNQVWLQNKNRHVLEKYQLVELFYRELDHFEGLSDRE